MTRTQAEQLLPIITAFAEGKTIQVNNYDGTWTDIPVAIAFSESPSKYRIKPEPVTRPWSKPEDVPLNCWLRHSGYGCEMFILCVYTHGITIHDRNDAMHRDWSELHDYEFSTDRKQWFPCTVTEAATP